MDAPQQLDTRRIECGPSEIALVANSFNEILRLPYFLDYYRSLGVDHFLINDNASSDGSIEFLMAQDDVHTFFSPGSFADARRGLDWLEHLRSTYLDDRWVVTADLDELFVYPMSEHVGLRALAEILDEEGARAVFAFMLDLYDDVPIDEEIYRSGQPFQEAHSFFDGAGYRIAAGSNFPPVAVFGGPRYRLHKAEGRRGRGAVLRKVPFVRWGPDIQYTAVNHSVTPTSIGSITGVMLHFKFLGPFGTKVGQSIERGELSAPTLDDYESFKNQIELGAPTLTYDGSIRYQDSLQLLDLGYIRAGKFGRNALVEAAKAIGTMTAKERGVAFQRMKFAEPIGDEDVSVPLGKALRLWPMAFEQR